MIEKYVSPQLNSFLRLTEKITLSQSAYHCNHSSETLLLLCSYYVHGNLKINEDILFYHWTSPRLRSQTETRYVQTEMNARRGCRAFKITRSGNTDERTMVWTWPHDGLDMNARWSGDRTMVWTWTHECLDMNARKIFVRSFPDFRAVISRPSWIHVQTIVRSCPDHRAFMSRLSRVHQTEKNYLLGCSADPWSWRQRGFQKSTNPDI